MRDGRRFRYPRSARVTRGADIRLLLREGRRSRCGPLEIYRSAAPGGRSRAAIVVPRYGHSVVERNQVKRRLRECVRTLWLPMAGEGETAEEILVRARPGAYGLGLSDLRTSFLSCAGGTP